MFVVMMMVFMFMLMLMLTVMVMVMVTMEIWSLSFDGDHVEVDFAQCRFGSDDIRGELGCRRLGAFHAAHKPDRADGHAEAKEWNEYAHCVDWRKVP